jgi:hypothetical protein
MIYLQGVDGERAYTADSETARLVIQLVLCVISTSLCHSDLLFVIPTAAEESLKEMSPLRSTWKGGGPP